MWNMRSVTYLEHGLLLAKSLLQGTHMLTQRQLIGLKGWCRWSIHLLLELLSQLTQNKQGILHYPQFFEEILQMMKIVPLWNNVVRALLKLIISKGPRIWKHSILTCQIITLNTLHLQKNNEGLNLIFENGCVLTFLDIHRLFYNKSHIGSW